MHSSYFLPYVFQNSLTFLQKTSTFVIRKTPIAIYLLRTLHIYLEFHSYQLIQKTCLEAKIRSVLDIVTITRRMEIKSLHCTFSCTIELTLAMTS